MAALESPTRTTVTDPYIAGLRWFDRGVAGENGEIKGLTKSPLEFYENAARQGDPLVEKGDCDAEYRVGLLYFLGKAKPQDNEMAVRLWTKAANGNQQRAQWALGDLYYHKHEYTFHNCDKCKIEKDLVQAYVWYRLLALSAKYEGEKDYAKFILGKLIPELTASQIREGDLRVAAWKPTPKDCGARKLL